MYLILLDPIYEKKANGRNGGVGTETQIISPEIYNKVKQEKFLPVIFERGENGEIPKTSVLKNNSYIFDLSQEEKYDSEYQRLVKTVIWNRNSRETRIRKETFMARRKIYYSNKNTYKV